MYFYKLLLLPCYLWSVSCSATAEIDLETTAAPDETKEDSNDEKPLRDMVLKLAAHAAEKHIASAFHLRRATVSKVVDASVEVGKDVWNVFSTGDGMDSMAFQDLLTSVGEVAGEGISGLIKSKLHIDPLIVQDVVLVGVDVVGEGIRLGCHPKRAKSMAQGSLTLPTFLDNEELTPEVKAAMDASLVLLYANKFMVDSIPIIKSVLATNDFSELSKLNADAQIRIFTPEMSASGQWKTILANIANSSTPSIVTSSIAQSSTPLEITKSLNVLLQVAKIAKSNTASTYIDPKWTKSQKRAMATRVSVDIGFLSCMRCCDADANAVDESAHSPRDSPDAHTFFIDEAVAEFTDILNFLEESNSTAELKQLLTLRLLAIKHEAIVSSQRLSAPLRAQTMVLIKVLAVVDTESWGMVKPVFVNAVAAIKDSLTGGTVSDVNSKELAGLFRKLVLCVVGHSVEREAAHLLNSDPEDIRRVIDDGASVKLDARSVVELVGALGEVGGSAAAGLVATRFHLDPKLVRTGMHVGVNVLREGAELAVSRGLPEKLYSLLPNEELTEDVKGEFDQTTVELYATDFIGECAEVLASLLNSCTILDGSLLEEILPQLVAHAQVRIFVASQESLANQWKTKLENLHDAVQNSREGPTEWAEILRDLLQTALAAKRAISSTLVDPHMTAAQQEGLITREAVDVTFLCCFRISSCCKSHKAVDESAHTGALTADARFFVDQAVAQISDIVNSIEQFVHGTQTDHAFVVLKNMIAIRLLSIVKQVLANDSLAQLGTILREKTKLIFRVLAVVDPETWESVQKALVKALRSIISELAKTK